MSENALEIHHLCKRYRGFALEDVSLVLPRGYVMGLIGPNGAGKTTIIKLLMNLQRRDAGAIKVLGLDNLADPIDVRSRIGWVFDEPCFFEDVHLEDHRRAIAPFYPGWNDQVFDRLVERFQIPRKKKFKALSQGMKKKFALALALSHDADLLVLDEPTSGLDPVFRRELLDCLAELLQDERKSVLFSTHIVSDLDRFADFVSFLHEGRIVFSLSKEELATNWGIVKGDESVVSAIDAKSRKGMRKNPYGVEVLTSDIDAARRAVGDEALVERATLEEIMVLMTRGERHAA